MSIDLSKLTISTAHKRLTAGDFSARELADSYLGEIEKKNKNLNAFLEIFDDVTEQAIEADKRLKNKKNVSVMTGIPIGMKDNILVKGCRCSAASKILEGYHATYDATVTRKLKDAGAVLLGRTNMDEFAMGSSTENSAYGLTKNPHDVTRVPGGSSGGSAASVAGGMALVALGSDTGGSIRQPASFCGVVGLKPTYGSVSRSGLMAMGSSLDVIGPLAKTVEDAELVFNTIKGIDPLDATSRDFPKESGVGKKLRVGLLTDFISEVGVGAIDPEVMKNYDKSVKLLTDTGYEVKPIKADISALKYALATYYIVMPAEVSSNLARFDGVKFGALVEGADLKEEYFKTRGKLFGKEVRRRIILGTYVLSSGYYDAYYNKGNIVRGLIQQTFKDIWKEVDIVVTPTAPTPAFKIGEKVNDPLQMYLEDIFTVTANVAGIPAVSVPSGKSGVLPLGLQFMATHGREDLLFEIGKKFEKIRGEIK